MQIDLREALRYAGVPEPDEAMLRRMEQVSAIVCAACEPRWIWRELALHRTEDGLALEGTDIVLRARLAETMLAGCDRAALLICTLGAPFDALLRAWQARDMAMALLIDACGSAFVEAGCDAAECAIASAHPALFLTDRFSPGYGDLPLTLQRPILRALDAGRRVGVTLTGSCLMNPCKSVTAIIGLAGEAQRSRIRGCAHCALADQCNLKRRGESCGA